jgi:hypothetical protein
MLGRAGYSARQIDSRSEFDPSSGEYLLPVKVIKYNPGSKAARILVGFGKNSGYCHVTWLHPAPF